MAAADVKRRTATFLIDYATGALAADVTEWRTFFDTYDPLGEAAAALVRPGNARSIEAGELFLERFFALYRKLMQADSNASSAPASPAAVTARAVSETDTFDMLLCTVGAGLVDTPLSTDVASVAQLRALSVFVRTSKSELPLAQLVSQLTVAMRQPTASVARAARSLFALLQTLDEAPTAAGSVDLGALGLTDIVLSELRASLSAVTRPTRHVRKSVSRLHVRRVGWQRLAAVLGELVLAVLRPNVRASSGPRSFISATPLVTAALSVTSTSTAVTAAASSTTTTTTTAAAAAAAAASGAPRRPTVPPPAQLSSTYVVPSHVPPPPPKASSPNKALQTQTASSAVDTSDLDVDEDDPLADLPPSNVAPTPYDEEMRRLAAGGLVTAKPAANAMTMDDDESSESAYFSAGDAARSSVSQSAGVALAVDASGTTAPARDLASRELASAIAGDIDAVDAGDVVVVDDESETVADDESARDDTIDDDDTDSETDESAIDGASPADATPAPDSSQTTTTTSTTSTAPSMPSGAAARPAIAARRAEDTTYEVLSLYDFDGKDADELSFKAGDRIVVVHRGEAKGWWAGSMARDVQALGPDKARVGLFPSSFTSPLKRRKSSKKVASVAAQ